MGIETQSLYFTGPRALEVKTETIAEPRSSELLLDLIVSGISAGTELNVYRGLAPQWRQTMNKKTRLFTHSDNSDWTWPARYGYASVGRVSRLGNDVEGFSEGDLVFAYVPHGRHAVVDHRSVVPLPGVDDPEIGIFFANLNTAYNGVLDANCALGADVVVSGLGVIGQMVTRLMRMNGVGRLIGVDGLENRRKLALAGGAHVVIDPHDGNVAEKVRELTDGRGADVVIEVSGAAPALNEAIRTTGFNGLVVAMSWYGGTFESLSLSGEFHHNRPRIVSSQVGAINPFLGPLWSIERRSRLAQELLVKFGPELKTFITHRIPLEIAAQGYGLLDQGSPDVMQILLDYRQ